MFADCWQVCSVSCHGSIMFDKVQNIKAAKPNPQSCRTGIVVRCFACFRVESSEPGAGALWETLTTQAPAWRWWVLGAPPVLPVLHSYLLLKVFLGICRVGHGFNPDYLQMGRNLPFVLSFTSVCQCSFLFLSPSPQSKVFLPWSLTWYMGLSKKWNWNGASVLWEQNCIFLAHSPGFSSLKHVPNVELIGFASGH